MGKYFRASTITEVTRSIDEECGLLKFTKTPSNKFIWTFKYQQRDSGSVRMLFRKKEDLIQDMKSKCEVGSSSKKIRLD